MAHFKTAWLQKEIPLQADVVGTTDLHVGDYVKLTTGDDFAYIEKSTIANATHLIAQSDMTLEYGHVPVEHRDYRYSDAVKCTVNSAPSSATTTHKMVALFAITDPTDVIPNADGQDHV